MFADDLKRNLTTMEKEKEVVDLLHIQALDEMKRDKNTLREFLKIKDKTISDL